MGGSEKMEFRRRIIGYEACISQISGQKTNLKSRPHILRLIIHYESKEYWNLPSGKAKIKELKYHKHNNNVVLTDL
jgi:hypothetical protein